MSARAAPAGVVLAGGASRRMGRDKALVEIDGVPMARRVADALAAGGCDPIEVQGGDAVALSELGLVVRADSRPMAGPVAAIADVLGRHRGGVVVAACDLPDLDGAAIACLIEAGADRGRAAVATVDGRHQLVAFLPAGAAAAWRQVAATGSSSVGAALARIGAIGVVVAPDTVRNVNAPGDLRAEEA